MHGCVYILSVLALLCAVASGKTTTCGPGTCGKPSSTTNPTPDNSLTNLREKFMKAYEEAMKGYDTAAKAEADAKSAADTAEANRDRLNTSGAAKNKEKATTGNADLLEAKTQEAIRKEQRGIQEKQRLQKEGFLQNALANQLAANSLGGGGVAAPSGNSGSRMPMFLPQASSGGGEKSGGDSGSSGNGSNQANQNQTPQDLAKLGQQNSQLNVDPPKENKEVLADLKKAMLAEGGTTTEAAEKSKAAAPAPLPSGNQTVVKKDPLAPGNNPFVKQPIAKATTPQPAPTKKYPETGLPLNLGTTQQKVMAVAPVGKKVDPRAKLVSSATAPKAAAPKISRGISQTGGERRLVMSADAKKALKKSLPRALAATMKDRVALVGGSTSDLRSRRLVEKSIVDNRPVYRDDDTQTARIRLTAPLEAHSGGFDE